MYKQNTYTCQIKVSKVFLKETKRLKVLWWCFILWFRNISRTKEKPNTYKKIYIRTLWAPRRYLIYKSHLLRYLDAFYMELKGLVCVKQTFCHWTSSLALNYFLMIEMLILVYRLNSDFHICTYMHMCGKTMQTMQTMIMMVAVG